jgi:hypothetical protein
MRQWLQGPLTLQHKAVTNGFPLKNAFCKIKLEASQHVEDFATARNSGAIYSRKWSNRITRHRIIIWHLRKPLSLNGFEAVNACGPCYRKAAANGYAKQLVSVDV